jgi:ribonuclease P protein component
VNHRLPLHGNGPHAMPDQPLPRPTFRKHERLSGRDRVAMVATKGQSVRIHPFRLVGLLMPLEAGTPAQVAFAVPKRHVKLAVDRNRVRRHMREAYRLNKHRWFEQLGGRQCAWLLIFQGSAPLPWSEASGKITRIFDRWTQEHASADR